MLAFYDLLERITGWANYTPDVRAALLIGSYARDDHPADAWSDMDVLVVARHHEQFIHSADWLNKIGPNLLTFIEPVGNSRSYERRTLFTGGLDVDLSFVSPAWLEGVLQEMPPDVADVIRRGARILVDKDGDLQKLLQIPLPAAIAWQKPTENEFINATSDFWFHTLWSARHLRRGELWWAKSGVDIRLKEHLRLMLEWHTHARRGDRVDTWLRGRFLEEWADPRAVEQLRFAFAHYDARDIADALHNTMNLYRWLEDETAACWDYAPPISSENRTAGITIELLKSL